MKLAAPLPSFYLAVLDGTTQGPAQRLGSKLLLQIILIKNNIQ
ncbi:hypothetical protein [Dyella sp.]